MEKMDGMSLDLTNENIEKLKELFPEVVTEGKIDFDMLRTVLGDEVDTGKEKYQFTWNGKTDSIKIAQTPSSATLRPCKEKSKDWDTTKNVFIEGDNLEVLKQLQKTYYGRIKMIYIDPPYNTGNDFVYKDDFRNSIEKYKEQTGQIQKSNPETNGRFHSDWLNMMYPRLLVSRGLLTDDGVIFISIDDNEQSELKSICDDIFGERNYLGCITWLKKRKGSFLTKSIVSLTEYLLVYTRNRSWFTGLYGGEANTSESQPIIKRTNKSSILSIKGGVVKTKLSDGKYNSGIYGDDINPVNLLNSIIVNNGIIENDFRIEAPFIWSQETFDKEVEQGTMPVVNTINMQIRVFRKYTDNNFKGMPSLINGVQIHGTNEDAYEELERIFGHKRIFDYSKPSNYIKVLVKGATHYDKNAVVLDFFSGSASTAHAVMQLNCEDGGSRKFIMVQLPELTEEESEAYKYGYRNICDIGEERIRRAGEMIKKDWITVEEKKGIPSKKPDEFPTDIGFKVFKLDSTNINTWDNTKEYDEAGLLTTQSVFKEDRGKDDILYEIMLKYGVFDQSVNEIQINGKTMYRIGYRYMIVCLEDIVDDNDVSEICKLTPRVVVFKESGFVDDNAKINAEYNLKRAGVEDIKCI